MAETTIDGTPISQLGLKMLASHQYQALPATRDYTAEIPGRHGAWDYGADMSERPFTLPFYFDNVQDPEEFSANVDKVVKILLDGYGRPRTVKVILGYIPDKYLNARYSGSLDVQAQAMAGFYDLPMTAFDPHAYSLTTNDEVFWGSESITFENRTYTYGHTGGGQVMTITQPTTYSVYVTGLVATPIITVSGSGTDVTLSTGGKTMSLSTFTDTNWLIDLAEYTALKNGQNGIGTFGNADWLEFMPGDNQLTVGGSGLNLTVQVKFRDKFM